MSVEKPREMTARIKLEIPVSPPRVIAAHEKFLKEALEYAGLSLQPTPLRNEVDEPGCQKYIEINYEVRSNHFGKYLLRATRRFLGSVAAAKFPNYFKGTLVTHGQEFYFTKLIPAVSDVCVSSIMFGNIQGGVFLNHWEVCYDLENHKVRSNDKIAVDFVFDRQDMITVKFENEELKSWTDTKTGERHTNEKRNVYYHVELQQTFVHRIIVDNSSGSDSYGKNRVRLYLQLNCPPVIRNGFFTDDEPRDPEKIKMGPRLKRTRVMKRGRNSEYPKDCAIADSPVFYIEFADGLRSEKLFQILARLHHRCGVAVEYAHFLIADCQIGYHNPYASWTWSGKKPTDPDEPIYRRFLGTIIENPETDQKEAARHRYAIQYLIECLLSRGAVVKDQLLLSQHRWTLFLNLLKVRIKEDVAVAEMALERLVMMIDERKRIGSIINAFVTISDQMKLDRVSALGTSLTDDEAREGYQKVRKIIFTPTRVIYVVPEMLMSNRVLRKYDPAGIKILRLSFRDDDNQFMRKSKTETYIMRETVEKYLLKGYIVAGIDYGYLGSSNSQMKDHGAYYMEKNTEEHIQTWRTLPGNKCLHIPSNLRMQIHETRASLGNFEDIESVPKMMARLGQCFTQSRLSTVVIDPGECGTTYDVTGGCVEKNLATFTFTDGVGMISQKMASELARDMGYFRKGVPSCYQFRFEGMKGVLAVNPLLDEMAAWAEKNRLASPEGEFASWSLKCVMRESQIKFEGTLQSSIEIVKPSMPVPVALNKPFINILDQVSEIQSLECNRRMRNRIETLLDEQLRGLAGVLLEETQCRNKLKELPARIGIDRLAPQAGFELSSEPFFRSLIKAAVKYSITKQLRKQQIQIPHHLGRTMLGVTDETGRLQYGQVFVRYTKSTRNRIPSPNAARLVLTGKVLLTKNPCNVEGDVRVFQAVDIPELRHHCDVIVFPQCGPRPHPDEMAGSDLDGDEYSVIWDRELLLDHNEVPFDYTAVERVDEGITKQNEDEEMVGFFLENMLQDSVGTISSAFLFQSDLYGIGSEVCMRLAKKIQMAVDFAKSGQAPKHLTDKWTTDEKTGKRIPPEKPERNPDFHGSDSGKPVYISARLLGKLYREIKTIEDVLRMSEDCDKQTEITSDSLLVHDSWEEYSDTAQRELAKYNTLIRNLMENYGIRTEAEIFSGCISEMKNRISDKEQDDMSFYNTNQLIETKITNIYRRFREEFFEEFGGWTTCTTVEQLFADENNVLHRKCTEPTDNMKKKAVAYYRVCYEQARSTRGKMLSFAWLAFDVLAVVKQSAVMKDPNFICGINPVIAMLTAHTDQYISENGAAFDDFRSFASSELGNAVEPLKKYCRMYPGLDRELFIVSQWAISAGLCQTTMRPFHFCLIFILFGINQFGSIDGDSKKIFDAIDLEKELTDIFEDDREPLRDASRHLVRFFEFLASRQFSRLMSLSFDSIGYFSCFVRGEWLYVHKSALKTYYHLIFNLRFDELPLSTDADHANNLVIRECEPFLIELPEGVCDELVSQKLEEKSRVTEIALRRVGMGKKQPTRVAVSARGTLESLDRLRNLVTVKPQIKTGVQEEELSQQLVQLVHDNIMRS